MVSSIQFAPWSYYSLICLIWFLSSCCTTSSRGGCFFSSRMISTKKRVLWPADGVWLGKMRCTFCGLVDVPVISGKCTIPWNPICQRLLLWTKNCVNSGRDERMSQRFMNWSTAINCFIYFIYPATIPTESQHFLPSNSNDFLVQLTFRHAHTTQHSVYYWNSCVLNHLYTLSMFKDIAFWAISYIVCLSFHFQTILVMLIIFRSLHTLIALTYWIGLWFNFRLAKRMKIGNMFNIQNYQAAR